MPIETVAVTIAGANPQTFTVSVPVDPNTGTGSQTITYTGSQGGTDTLSATATVTGHNFSSNSAQVNWQSTNNSIQIGGPVNGYAWHDSPTSGAVACYIWSTGQRPFSSAPSSAVGNSISFSASSWATLNSSGGAIGSQAFPPYTSDFNVIVVGNFIVPAAGSYTLTLTYKDTAMWGLGASTTGAVPTWAGKGSFSSCNGQRQTVNGSFPLLNAPPLTSGSDGVVGSGSTVVTFPAAGTYPFEVDWDYWYHSGRVLHATVNGAEISPVTLIGAPPTGANPTGNLTITPTGGNTNLQFVGQPISLTVTLSGIGYVNEPYVPVLEGTAGNLFIYNSASSPTFTYPTYNGLAVDKAAAVANNALVLSGDNGSWQGRMGVIFDGTNFALNYNGNPPDNHVDTTVLTVSADDVAWYNGAAKTFDLFGLTQAGGGVSTQIKIDWMARAAIASVTPTTVASDGGAHTFTVSLVKPISPRQQGTQFGTGNTFAGNFSMVGATVTSVTPIFDGARWLTGWTVVATVPNSTSNGTITLNATIAGNLTYLNGTTFTTGSVTYVNGAIATINTTGASFSPPQAYQFAISPAGPAYDDFSGTISLTGIVFVAQNDPVSLTFIGRNQSNSSQFNIAAGNLVASQPGTFNGQSGYLKTFTATTGPSFVPISPGATIGFTATDTTSNLSVTYLTSTAYFFVPATSGGGDTGGGGSGGCFTEAVAIETPEGLGEFGSFPVDRPFEIVNETGAHLAELVVHDNYKGWMIKLAAGKLVTLDHIMKQGTDWLSANQKQSYKDLERVWFEGTVYNLHVLTNNPLDQHYILFNGDVAHNLKAAPADQLQIL